MKKYSLLSSIGNTPMVEIKKLNPNPGVKIFAKLEGNNPGGSVKDRVAEAMIRRAEEEGSLSSSKVILEATSGNTGIALAMIAALRNYRFTAVLPESVSIERKKLLKAYGAKVIFSDPSNGTNGAIKLAREILRNNSDHIMLDQFNNLANVSTHYLGTGQEIIDDVPEIDAFVAGMGTGGTLMGVGQKLKEANPKIKIVGIEPYPKSKIQGLRNMKAYIPSIYHRSKLDLKLMVEDQEAFSLAFRLFAKEGLSVGISSGAALWGAIQVAKKIKNGTVVTLFPDRGDKYLSTPLFN